ILFDTLPNEPVRAHIVNATGLHDKYIFGVLGSFGTHIPPSQFAKQSKAVVTMNGGFFSSRPSRASGLVMAHGKILYPPLNPKYLGTVGFHTKGFLIDKIEPADIKGYTLSTEKAGWNECHAALGAGPILVLSGTNVVKPLEDAFYTKRHPRTGIGITRGGEAVLIVVDGRQTEWSVGVTLDEFANLFLELGAEQALNLDGGGSSTLLIGEELVNHPSHFAVSGEPGVERAVANVIALFHRE
ncbi:MAG: phosphodiester glycosidase family protein, partial [Chloroflexi bacterium]|nr:phosphodiester glycosidase family protein [Chloroflexota bacterium]